jgi:hypothetical protein
VNWRSILVVSITLFLGACSEIPDMHRAPQNIFADGVNYTACTGIVNVYTPSRDVSDSSEKTYEITFTDDFGKLQDLEDIHSYQITKDPAKVYMMPYSMPDASVTKYANGAAFVVGDVVMFGKDGDDGRAMYVSPGSWKPVPCK